MNLYVRIYFRVIVGIYHELYLYAFYQFKNESSYQMNSLRNVLGLITAAIDFFKNLINKDLSYLMARSANDGWEDSPGGIITSETSFAHAGAIVDNKSSNVFISHFRFELFSTDNCQKNETLSHHDC